MAYRDILVHNQPVAPLASGTGDIYLPWEEVRSQIYKEERHARVPCKEREYQVLLENDHLVFDITKELRERFEFKGLLRECNMTRLMEIFTKHMRLEEIFNEDDDEDVEDDA